MRRPILLILLVAVAGCGGGDRTSQPPPAVRLTLLGPADATTVEAGEVTVRGRVAPKTAEVRVRGERVDVTGGEFSTTVALDEGANLVDVSASASGRRPATTALRVVREVPVEIPALEGEPADEAIERLEQLGLEVERRRGGGLLDDLLPGDPEVCSLEPAPGTRVKRGTTVTVEVARTC
jgi:hypothetical protein